MAVLNEAKAQVEAQRWITEPIYWARKFGGAAFDPSSDQERFWIEYGKMLNARIKKYKGCELTEEDQYYNGKVGISIMAGQGVGKGATISLCGLHYLICLQAINPKVVCTAPAGPQLYSSLWPEYSAWMARSEMIAAMVEKQAHRIFLKHDKERGGTSRIEPRTVQQNSSPDAQQEVLAGIHALGVLYQIDEGSGVEDPVFKPIEGGLTDPLSLIVMIFNPTRRTGFAIESHKRNRADWVCLHWSGRTLREEKLNQPQRFKWFNEEAQLRVIRKYGEHSDFVRVRVDGLPPNEASNCLIPYGDVEEAMHRQVETLPSDPLVVACDVGGGGDDPSVIMAFRGPKLVAVRSIDEDDTSRVADAVAEMLSEQLMECPPGTQYVVGVDYIGMGRGVYSNLQTIHQIRYVYAIDVSEASSDQSRFHRLRDEIWWMAREAFKEERTPVLPAGTANLDDLVGELTSILWSDADGKVKVQGKGASGIRDVPPLAKSPNYADTWCIGNYLLKKYCSRVPLQARRVRGLVGAGAGRRNWRTV